MSLDDRSLREHLARRADAGSTNPDDLAESVIAALPSSGSTSRWRPFVRAGQALAVAAAVVVAIVAAQTLTSQRGVEPGPSAGATPESTQTTDYPAVRAMTGEELEAFLLPDPALRAGVVVVANVEVRAASPSCPVAQPSIPENCPTIAIVLPGRTLLGFGEVDPGLVGPFAFRVRDTGELELLGTVQAGPDRLSWSLSQYLAELPGLLGPGADPSGKVYLVQGTATRMGQPACPSGSLMTGSTFDVGCGPAAWLLPLGMTVPTKGTIETPAQGVRIQNGAPDGSTPGLGTDGFFVVRPLGVDACFMCIVGATSQYLGTVNPFEPLSPDPTAVTTPSRPASEATGGPSLTGIVYSTNAVTLSGFETADVNVTATFGGDVVEFGQMDGSLTPLVCLGKTDYTDPLSPHNSTIARTMVRTAGTNEWVASFRVTAGDSGQWRTTCLIAYDGAGHELNINPSLAGFPPVLDITGNHAPLLTMAFKPSPAEVGQPLEVFGQVTDQDTGDPYGGVVVTVGRDNVCAEGGAGKTVTTNSNGAYTFTIAKADEFPVCTWITDVAGILPGVNAQDPIAVYGMLFAHPTEP